MYLYNSINTPSHTTSTTNMYNNTDFTYWRRARPIPIFAISPPEPVVREWRVNHKQHWRDDTDGTMYWTECIERRVLALSTIIEPIIAHKLLYNNVFEHSVLNTSVLNTIIERQAKNEKQGKHQNKSVKPPSKQDAKDNHFHHKKTILRTFTLENLLSWENLTYQCAVSVVQFQMPRLVVQGLDF